MKTFLDTGIFAVFLAISFSSNALLIGSGTLTTTDSTLVTTGSGTGWNDTTLTWSVDQTGTTYTYTYNWSGATGNSLSHVSFEVSDSFTSSNFLAGSTATSNTAGAFPDVPSNIGPDGNSPNDEDAATIYAVKYETDDSNGDILDFNIVLISDRAPIWSDIFFKTGQIDMTNSGYTLADPAVGGANPMTTGITGFGYIAAPDTAVIPIPAAVWLFGSALIGLVGIRRRSKTQ